jgi:hypothetical protein
MKKVHESQSTETFNDTEVDQLYTPLDDLQKIEAGGVYKRNNLNLKTLPKGIRWIGYFIIGFILITSIIGFALSFIN